MIQVTYQVVSNRKCKQPVNFTVNCSNVWRMAANVSNISNRDIPEAKQTSLNFVMIKCTTPRITLNQHTHYIRFDSPDSKGNFLLFSFFLLVIQITNYKKGKKRRAAHAQWDTMRCVELDLTLILYPSTLDLMRFTYCAKNKP